MRKQMSRCARRWVLVLDSSTTCHLWLPSLIQNVVARVPGTAPKCDKCFGLSHLTNLSFSFHVGKLILYNMVFKKCLIQRNFFFR